MRAGSAVLIAGMSVVCLLLTAAEQGEVTYVDAVGVSLTFAEGNSESSWATTRSVFPPSDVDCAEPAGNVAILLDPTSTLYDAAAFAGAEEAALEFCYEITVIESVSSTEAVDSLYELAAEGAQDLIVCVGMGYVFDLANVAEEYPSQMFAWIEPQGAIDWVEDLPNVMSITFRANEMAALAGALAGLVAAQGDHTVVSLALDAMSPSAWDAEAGFRLGVSWANERSGQAIRLAYSRTDLGIQGGIAAAKRHLDEGAVGLYTAGGAFGIGAFEAICEAHEALGTALGPPYYFGAGMNQDLLGDGRYVLASVLARVDRAVRFAVQAIDEGTFAGGATLIGIEEDAVKLSDRASLEESLDAEDVAVDLRRTTLEHWEANRSAIPDSVWEDIERFATAIRDGSIVVPTAQTEAELQLIRDAYPLEPA